MEHLDLKRKITIMLAIMSAMLFAALNQTIVGTALPRIINELGGMEYFSWVFTIYMLASTVTAVLVGKLSDIYGRKPFILAGIIIFMIGSFLAGLSSNIFELIVYRGVQGLGAGVIMSSAFTVVGDLFAPRERGRWQGIMSSVFGVSSILGPMLGGYIVDNTDWHWVFWVFLPVGILALVLIWVLFPSTVKRQGESIDYLGSVFLTATIIPILLAFSWGGDLYAWGSLEVLGLFAAAAICLVLFIIVELKAKNPALPLGLFKNSVFTVSNLVGFLMGAGMFGTIMYMPFFLQGVIGTTALVSGYVMIPMTLSMVIASAVAGQMITKSGKYKTMALGGLLVMSLGMLLLSFMDRDTSNLLAVFYMIIVGTGLGVGFPIFTLTIQNAVDDRLLGVSTASAQLFRQLGGTIGVSVMATIMNFSTAKKLSTDYDLQLVDLEHASEEVMQQLEKLQDPQILTNPEEIMEIRNALPSEMHELFGQMIFTLRDAFGHGLSVAFLSGAIIVFAAFIATFFLKELPLRTSMGRK